MMIALAACVGLGDIAQVSPATTIVLNGVHAMLLLAIALALAADLRARQWPHFPSWLALPTAVWLGVMVASAGLAPRCRSGSLTYREEARRDGLASRP